MTQRSFLASPGHVGPASLSARVHTTVPSYRTTFTRHCEAKQRRIANNSSLFSEFYGLVDWKSAISPRVVSRMCLMRALSLADALLNTLSHTYCRFLICHSDDAGLVTAHCATAGDHHHSVQRLLTPLLLTVGGK